VDGRGVRGKGSEQGGCSVVAGRLEEEVETMCELRMELKQTHWEFLEEQGSDELILFLSYCLPVFASTVRALGSILTLIWLRERKVLGVELLFC
jgi:hypothetical protein